MYNNDHYIQNTLSTMKMLEEEKVKVENLGPDDKESYKLCEHKFNTLRLKWIETTYRDKGQQILKLLRINPCRAIPIIYERLKTNYDRAVENKKESLGQWHEICAKNFQKSLDHRSLLFK